MRGALPVAELRLERLVARPPEVAIVVDGAESRIRRDVDAVDEGHVVVHGHDAIDAFGVHDVGVEGSG